MSAQQEDRKKETLYSQYQTLLNKYPLITNATQSGLITAVGVLVSQVLSAPVGQPTIFDSREVYVMTFINIAWITPVLLWFFGFLNTIKRGTLDKLLIDQFVFSPPFTASIIALRYILYDGGSVDTVPTMLMNIVPGVQLTAWMFWIPSRFLIINYVPASLALLVNSAASLVWTVIFAMLLNK